MDLRTQRIAKRCHATIKISRPDNDNGPVFTFDCAPISVEDIGSLNKAFDSGHAMFLKGLQVKTLKQLNSRKIMKYHINFDFDDDFQEQCIAIANGQFEKYTSF